MGEWENIEEKKRKDNELAALFSSKIVAIQEKYAEYLERHEIVLVKSIRKMGYVGKWSFEITVTLPQYISDEIKTAFDSVYYPALPNHP